MKPVLLARIQHLFIGVYFLVGESTSVRFGAKSLGKVAPRGVIVQGHTLGWTEDCSVFGFGTPALRMLTKWF